MSKYKTFKNELPFLDMLFNLLMVFIILFMLAFSVVSPKAEQNKKKIESPVQAIITITWPKDSKTDVDVYVANPLSDADKRTGILFFANREIHMMNLDRDDQGSVGDNINHNGTTYDYNENREVVSFRNLIPGEYICNIHDYNHRDPGPVEVTIMLEKLNPSIKLYVMKKLTLERSGDEQTAFRFTVTPEGEIIDINDLPKIFVGQANRNLYNPQNSDGIPQPESPQEGEGP